MVFGIQFTFSLKNFYKVLWWLRSLHKNYNIWKKLLCGQCNKSPVEWRKIIIYIFKKKVWKKSTCEILGINYLSHVTLLWDLRSFSIMFICILFLVMSQNRLFIIFNLYVVFHSFLLLLLLLHLTTHNSRRFLRYSLINWMPS
jgi:hypothetical protein